MAGGRGARRRDPAGVRDASPSHWDAAGRRRHRAGGRAAARRRPAGQNDRRAEKRRGPRKATLGSTSYDEAVDQPFDPDWAGSSWYGTTSGTYWTLNPREYADPRKHGPEYQARARRAAGDPARPDLEPASEPESEPQPEAASGEPANGPAMEADPAPADAEPAPADVPTGAGSGWRPAAETSAGAEWSATPGSIDEGTRSRGPGAAPWPGDSRLPPRDDEGTGAPPFDPGAVLPNLARLFDPRVRRRPAARLALALAGGIPVALWLAWLLGELSGCGRFAASCEPRMVGVAWLVGLVLVGALVLLPAIAAVLAAGAAGALVAAVPATFILTATGGARMPEESSLVLGVALMTGWLFGVGLAARRWLGSSGRAGPVS